MLDDDDDDDESDDPVVIEKGDVKRLHNGTATTSIVQIIDVKLLWEKNKPVYRSFVSDTDNISKNFVFNPKLNTRVIEELKSDIQKPIIKILEYKIQNKCIVMIEEFKMVEDVIDIIGLPQALPKKTILGFIEKSSWMAINPE